MIATGKTVLSAAVSMLAMLTMLTASSAETKVETYFENTDHELTVYRIVGKEPGATVMIIGGIQGDEPGGYIAADLYADMLLEKGNIIVVPRANFFSIKRNNRGVNGDMNRKFSPGAPANDDYDYRIIEILKKLMSESDVLLNLHEGSGFYYPENISSLKNPMRYGQSIIIDAVSYDYRDGVRINLEEPALKVIDEINRNIKNPEHKFHLNNHDTFSPDTKHAEQRGSATYNALSLYGIPAYGIETSKNIGSITTKVKYETLAINAFIREYGIIPEHPRVYLPTPKLDHLVVTIAGNPNPFAIENGSTLSVIAGTQITVSSVVANYKRGLSIDIIDHGNTNDLNRTTKIESPTRIKVYKDAFLCGEITIDITHGKRDAASPHIHTYFLDQIAVRVDDKNIVVSNGDTLHIIRGDVIRIVDAWTNDRNDRDFRINFYGFVGNRKFNDAEDRGYDIDTASDLIGRFSLDRGGSLYRVEAIKKKTVIGRIFIKLEEPKIQFLIVEHADGTREAFEPGDTISCGRLEAVKILSIVSNVTARPHIETFWTWGNDRQRKLTVPSMLDISANGAIRFWRKSVDLGSISFTAAGKPDGALPGDTGCSGPDS
ncbi:MAG: succinylglutamate desuccinylase/aspartoacylase family protein [Candidatus Latescibacteria bacterium]|nr:succinylglutamate desuccinylase/aspartoacylase family protein [Candidatus Latescibacterota bacterium]